MAWIKKVRDGKFRVLYRDPAGGQRSQTFATRSEAKEFASQFEVDKKQGTWTDPKAGKITLNDWVEEWWPTTLNLRPSTRARDRSYINNYLLPRFGSMPLSAVTPMEIRHWVAELNSEGFAPSTTIKAYQILSKIFRSAVDVSLLPISPCRGVSLPKIEQKEMRFLSVTELLSLADAIDPRFKALVLVAGFCGLRWAELVGLRKARVDLNKGIIEVAEILVEIDGSKFLEPSQPKTKAGRRSISVPSEVMEELARHMQASFLHSDYVFTAPEGGPLRKSLFRSRFWLPAIRAAGVEPLRVHDLRHTAVSVWISARANIKVIQRRAGHTSAAVVLDRYGHMFPEEDERLTQELDNMIRNARRMNGSEEDQKSH